MKNLVSFIFAAGVHGGIICFLLCSAIYVTRIRPELNPLTHKNINQAQNVQSNQFSR